MSVLYVSTDEGVYVDSNGKPTKDIQLQWGEVPSSIGKFTFFSVDCGHHHKLTIASSINIPLLRVVTHVLLLM